MSRLRCFDILCCPEDHSKLENAPSALVDEINRGIGQRRIQNRAGRTLDEPIDGGLVRAKGDVLYPIARGIPLLLRDEAIAIERFGGQEKAK